MPTGDPTTCAMRPCIVVTGGSRGIGLALAKKFAAKGHDILLIARGSEDLEHAAKLLRLNHPALGIHTLALDITSVDSVGAIEQALIERNLFCSILINNAAAGLSGPFYNQSSAEISGLLNTNILALTRLTHAVLAGMRTRGKGAIINMASLGAYVPGPHQAVYYASKAYVVSLSEALSAELSGSGIRVMAILPGPVPTSFHKNMAADRALYRLLIPQTSPDKVARSAYRAFVIGRRVVVPGIMNQLFAFAIRLAPHFVSIPLIAWLLKNPDPDHN